MSIRVLLRDYPSRAIALVTSTQALIFRHSPSTADAVQNGSLVSVHSIQSRTSTDGQSIPRCMVEFSTVDSVDLSDYRTLSPIPVHGTLGLITISNDVFICLVTGASKVASVRPGETVERIYAVEFYCLNNSEYDNIRTDDIDPYGDGLRQDNYYGQTLSRRDPLAEHPCEELQKLLSNGSFYYSTDFDLTNRVQDRSVDASKFDINNLDESYLWNSYMIRPLVKFRSRLVSREKEALDSSRILTSAIRGFVSTITIPLSSSPIRTSKSGLPSTLTLVSRLSCRRAGTRFNSRGIDDDGYVANFVETETVYWSPAGMCFSYVQVRGSVPVFWEQAAGLIPGQQKITVTRSKEGTQPAFDKHFRDLEQSYGAVHVVNLLSKTKPGEAELTGLYRYGVQHCSLNDSSGENPKDHELLKETEYDFHAETRGPDGYEAASMVRQLIEESAKGFGYYLSQETEDSAEVHGTNEKRGSRSAVVLMQEGVFRTNCLDCLDRTNLVQTIISQMSIESFLGGQGERGTSDFWMRHSSLWADNGDALSRIYAGTGALKSSFTRHGKMSLAGAIADARKSATRLYINNFADKGRQNTMDVLLGRLVGQTPVHLYDPINDYVTTELNKRSGEYSSSKSINIWAGTFNLNGRTNGVNSDLSEWFCPDPKAEQPEIVVVGFQEIVELSPQQIMNSDPTRKQAWEETVRATLNKNAQRIGGEQYVLLRSGQLVGAALCIFVKASVLKDIKNVEGSSKKTGLSGMAGNKGAVAIRMDYANTQICFVTAHLAAGFANYDERNKDYHTISHGLRFQRNRGIDDHDTVIWMGDFNYRIGMSAERVKGLLSIGDLETLYDNDQLNIQMVAGLTFPHYSEARITFMPTYKFDLGSDKYDSSEKARIPAWTDRVLRKGTNLRQISYGTAPLRFSDHRPVFAQFNCTVSIIDETIRETLSHVLYEKRRADVGATIASSRSDDTDDEDLIGYDAIEPGLPPASSDRRKWWIENGLPARSSIQPPQRGAFLNPNRPSNPFAPSDEPDWVTVPNPNRTNTSESFQSAGIIPSASSSVNSRGRPGKRVLPPPFYPSRNTASTLPSASTSVPRSRALPARPIADITTPPPPARRSSTTSTVSTTSTSTSKKPAPPVAKKPTHLSSASSTPTMNTPVDPQNGFQNPPPTFSKPTHTVLTRKQTQNPNLSRSLEGVQMVFPPPPRKTGAATISVAGFDPGVEPSPSTPPPPPQSRRTTRATGVVRRDVGNMAVDAGPRLLPRPVDLLGDDEDAGLTGWEVLKPSG